jgi:hypothetical protein
MTIANITTARVPTRTGTRPNVRRRVTSAAATATKTSADGGGDDRVQDEIVRTLNAQLAEYKETQRTAVVRYIRYEVKKREVIDDHFDAMAETRRTIADQTRKYLQDLERLTESRVSLALNCALADILDDLGELQREIDDWKIDHAPDDVRGVFGRMNEGLFFKNLYDDEPRRPERAASAAVSYAAVSYVVLAVAVLACVISR